MTPEHFTQMNFPEIWFLIQTSLSDTEVLGKPNPLIYRKKVHGYFLGERSMQEQLHIQTRMKNLRSRISATTLVLLMVMSTTLAMMPVGADSTSNGSGIFATDEDRTPYQLAEQGGTQQGGAPVPGAVDRSHFTHPALRDPSWNDLFASSGKISDLSAISLRSEAYAFLLEETNLGAVSYTHLRAHET